MQRSVCAWNVWVACIAVAAASLACNLNVGGPTPPGSPIPVSTESAAQLEELWKNAIENSHGGQISVVVNEQQLTSFLALKLAEQPDPPLSDVQVYLRDSRIRIYGTAKAGSVSTTAMVSLAVAITPEGQAQLSVDQADFGPVPVPASLLEKLSASLNEALTGRVGSLATGIKISSVLIADGNMGIIGTLRK